MEPTPKHGNRLDKLESKLYSRTRSGEYRDDRTSLERPEIELDQAWKHEDGVEDLISRSYEEKERSHSKLFRNILWGSVAFFILAAGIGAYLFFGGSNFVSANNIAISVSAPSSVSGGEELSLEIIVSNNNNAALEGATLLIEYPAGSRVAGDISTELSRQREVIDVIPAHSEARKTVKSVLFGEKDAVQTIKITLEYRIEGSSATFFKDKLYDIGIRSAPIIVTPSYPREINAGQQFEMVLDIASNTGETLHDVLVTAEYPFGFTFISSIPEPYADNNVWRIGDFATGERQTVRILGTLQAQNEEERTFHFSSGIASNSNPRTLGVALSTLAETLKIERSPIALDITLAGRPAESYAARLGESVPITVVWTNNLSSRLLNARMEVKLSGPALDRGSVRASNNGFFRSVDNTIVWDKTTTPAFDSLEPGARGALNFNFAPLQSLPSSAGNQDIIAEISFSGTEQRSDGTSQNVLSRAQRTVKLASSLALSAKAVRSSGPFENSGPVPPRAEQLTTYTVIWTLSNSLNEMSNVRVEATLPQYVSWTALSSPASESIYFDPVANTVVWNAGTVQSGTGFGGPLREVAFQIGLFPSLSQVGSAPILVGAPSLSARDTFTGNPVTLSGQALTTRLLEPGLMEGHQTVGQ